MKVDFNNLRKQAAYSLDRVIKKLNSGVMPETTYANNTFEGDVLVSSEDLKEEIDELRSYVYAICCCYEEGNPDNKDLSGEIERTGGIARFNENEP